MLRSRILLLLVAVVVVAALGLTSGVMSMPGAVSAGLSSQAVNYSLGQSAGPVGPWAPAFTPEPVTERLAAMGVSSAPVTITIQPGADTESQILSAVYQKVNPSVVEVVNLAQASGFRGASLGIVPQGEGSGFLWDTQGHIVTNDHVVDGADKLQIVFADGTEADATLVGTDPNGDIAVIQVDPSLVAGLQPVEQGDMGQVQVGDLAIAIGNPFGYQNTMTRGIVSALGRSIPSQTQYSIPEAIQTDAAINPGNSGGPLLNSLGQVIGINDQIESSSGSSSGVGFAIPIDLVQRIVPSLIKNGSYQHAYLGITGDTYSRLWAQALGVAASARGVYVMDAASGGPSANAGLRGGTRNTDVVLSVGRRSVLYLQSGGDLITAIDNQPITKMDDLLQYLDLRAAPGQSVQLAILRGGKQQTVTVTLGVRPDQQTLQSQGNGEPQA